MAGSGPIDSDQRRLAERRLLAALRRLHRREPLRADVRVDALLAAARESSQGPARGHRGSTPLALSDPALQRVIDDLAASGRLIRHGRRVRLPDHRPTLGADMRDRVDRLLDGLRESGASPPRVDGPAARLGIPPGIVAQLRATGELVPLAPGIDYPRDSWEALNLRVDRLAERGPLSVARVRDSLRTSRRHAAAILAHRRAQRQRARSRRPAG